MALITWIEDYSVHVREFDEHHKMLTEMINSLDEANCEDETGDAALEIVVRMTGYAAQHFSAEERYFDKYDYPGAEIHKREHAAFVKKVKAFELAFINGSTTLSTEVLDFLCGWLKEHILSSDKKYSSFFNERGLE